MEGIIVFDGSNKVTSPKTKLGLLAELARNARLVWRLLRDSRVALATKLLVPGLTALYILSPVDLIPDVIPILGQLDDLAVLVVAVKLFIELCPTDIVRQHLAQLAGENAAPPGDVPDGEIVDADYRVIE
jgi:uncharacterized membrane protein YkvA (DUF1232 family)